MKKLTTFDEFLNEAVKVLTYDGKKPDTVLNVEKLTYEDMCKLVDERWGEAALPLASGQSGSVEYTFYISEKPNSAMETKYRKDFDAWKKEVINKWGKTIEIFIWNTVRQKPIFQFMPGSSKEFDKEMERINNLKPSMPADALHAYYHGQGSKGRYFGD